MMSVPQKYDDPYTKRLHGISVELKERDYWHQFRGHTLEMIACRKGRNLFPILQYEIHGLHPHTMYSLYLDLRRVGDKRHSYDQATQKWTVSMDDEPLPKSQCVYESDISPKMGSFLEGKTINFKHVKLVNTKQDKHDANELNRDQHNPMIYVHTKCFYEPYLVIRCGNARQQRGADIMEFHFPVTRFVTVTAYRNNTITELKIQFNPKARAFKIKKDRKRKHSDGSDDASENGGDGSLQSIDEKPAKEACIYPSNGADVDGMMTRAMAPDYTLYQTHLYSYPNNYGFATASAQPAGPLPITAGAHQPQIYPGAEYGHPHPTGSAASVVYHHQHQQSTAYYGDYPQAQQPAMQGYQHFAAGINPYYNQWQPQELMPAVGSSPQHQPSQEQAADGSNNGLTMLNQVPSEQVQEPSDSAAVAPANAAAAYPQANAPAHSYAQGSNTAYEQVAPQSYPTYPISYPPATGEPAYSSAPHNQVYQQCTNTQAPITDQSYTAQVSEASVYQSQATPQTAYGQQAAAEYPQTSSAASNYYSQAVEAAYQQAPSAAAAAYPQYFQPCYPPSAYPSVQQQTHQYEQVQSCSPSSPVDVVGDVVAAEAMDAQPSQAEATSWPSMAAAAVNEEDMTDVAIATGAPATPPLNSSNPLIIAEE